MLFLEFSLIFTSSRKGNSYLKKGKDSTSQQPHTASYRIFLSMPICHNGLEFIKMLQIIKSCPYFVPKYIKSIITYRNEHLRFKEVEK